MWQAVYQISTGALVSTGTVITDPLPAGMASKPLGGPPDGQVWNPSTLQFDPVPVERAVDTLDFMRRFTMQEEAAIRTAARTDAMAEVFLWRMNVAKVVHLDHTETTEGVNYCVSIGAITAARGLEILNG